MSLRVQLLAALAVLLAGMGVGLFGQSEGWFADDADWEQQIHDDVRELLKVLGPPPSLHVDLEREPEFWEAWEPRFERYPEEKQRRLRDALSAYVDLMEAEYGDVLEISLASGDSVVSVMENPSDRVKRSRAAVEERLGELGATLVEQSRGLREDAFRAAPGVAGHGIDEVNYEQLGRRVLQEWAPAARERVIQLTGGDSDQR